VQRYFAACDCNVLTKPKLRTKFEVASFNGCRKK